MGLPVRRFIRGEGKVVPVPEHHAMKMYWGAEE
jgi:hypothetical protein